MLAFVASRISDHLAFTPEGFLLCRGVVLCRTGIQEYKESELYDDGADTMVKVHRAPADVLSPQHIGSLEGKPLCGPGHPPSFLTPQNVAAFQRGHVQNIRAAKLASGEGCLIGDLLVTDPVLIDQILNGAAREISTGYVCRYEPRPDGDLDQKNFLANHVAVVGSGRANAGRRPAEVRIMDSEVSMKKEPYTVAGALTRLQQIIELLDKAKMAPVAVQDHAARVRDFQAAEFDRRLATASGSPEAIQFAESCNALGRKLRGLSDCRPSLVTRAADARPAVLCADDGEDFALKARAYHRR